MLPYRSLLTDMLNTFNKWLAAILRLVFVSFGLSWRILELGFWDVFLWCCCVFRALSFNCNRIWWHRKLAVSNDWRCSLGCEPAGPPYHWLPEHSLIVGHAIHDFKTCLKCMNTASVLRNFHCGLGGPRFCLLRSPPLCENQYLSNQAVKDHCTAKIQHGSGFPAFWDISAICAEHIAYMIHHRYFRNSLQNGGTQTKSWKYFTMHIT